ncbi:MAG: NAD(P)/FAD-dependent oxidoreductase [Clostridia bacterium]|nr:NAD(P)/FAD-dependent oxidoreductase [Clostridia bacterium]
MKRCVIIGGGPAGLTAGYELLKQSKDYEVVILEQSDALGGISRTVQYHGHRMDIGGHRFFSKDPRVTAFWNEILPTQGAPSIDDKLLGREKPLVPGGPDPETTDEVMLIRRRISRIYYLHKFFDYPISMKPQTFINMGLPRTVKAGCSYLKSTVAKKEETSLENFYINRFGKVLYSMFFEGYTEKLWGRHPSEISADWGAQRVKGLSILAVLKDMVGKLLPQKDRKVETSLIEEFVYPKFGPGQLWEAVGKRFTELGGEIRYGHPVTEILTDGGRVTGVKCTVDGKETLIEGDIFISSMPIKDLVAGMGGAAAPDAARIAAGLPYRDFVTVGLLVDKLALKNETGIPTLGNIVPDCWIYVQDVGVKLGRIQIFNNWSPYLVKDPQHTVWIGLEYFCAEGDDFWNLDEAACVELAVGELRSMGVLAPDAQVLDSHRERVQKAYPAYFDTYAEMDKLVAFLDGFENLFCVGRNGQHRYNNMDHSMATSFEAVKNILAGSTEKANLWSVNTEAEYHETGKK